MYFVEKFKLSAIWGIFSIGQGKHRKAGQNMRVWTKNRENIGICKESFEMFYKIPRQNWRFSSSFFAIFTKYFCDSWFFSKLSDPVRWHRFSINFFRFHGGMERSAFSLPAASATSIFRSSASSLFDFYRVTLIQFHIFPNYGRITAFLILRTIGNSFDIMTSSKLAIK